LPCGGDSGWGGDQPTGKGNARKSEKTQYQKHLYTGLEKEYVGTKNCNGSIGENDGGKGVVLDHWGKKCFDPRW